MQTNKEIREEWSSEGWMKHGVHEDNLEGIADWWLSKIELQEEKLRERIRGMKKLNPGFIMADNNETNFYRGFDQALSDVLQVLEENK